MTEIPETEEQRSLSASSNRVGGGRPWLSLSALAAGSLFLVLANLPSPQVPALSAESQGQFILAEAGNMSGDYSSFPHTNAAHSRLPCALCHRRENNSPRPVRSIGHTPCAGCHTQQFADSSNPICTICHTDPGSSNPPVKPFPVLKSFNMKFDHARHRSVECSTCHKSKRNGVAFSIPAGLQAHETCYKCHAPRAQVNGRDISSCSTCHKPGSFSRTPEWAKAFKVNFSHARHEREGLSCSDCHSIRAGAAQKRKIISPVASQHFPPARGKSCATCHDNKRAFSGDDFSDCRKCHQGPTFRF